MPFPTTVLHLASPDVQKRRQFASGEPRHPKATAVSHLGNPDVRKRCQFRISRIPMSKRGWRRQYERRLGGSAISHRETSHPGSRTLRRPLWAVYTFPSWVQEDQISGMFSEGLQRGHPRRTHVVCNVWRPREVGGVTRAGGKSTISVRNATTARGTNSVRYGRFAGVGRAT